MEKKLYLWQLVTAQYVQAEVAFKKKKKKYTVLLQLHAL